MLEFRRARVRRRLPRLRRRRSACRRRLVVSPPRLTFVSLRLVYSLMGRKSITIETSYRHVEILGGA